MTAHRRRRRPRRHRRNRQRPPKGAVFSGPVATFTDANPRPPPADFTATIAWGDGTIGAGSVVSRAAAASPCSARHTYAEASTTTLTLRSRSATTAAPRISGNSIHIAVADAPLGGLSVHGPHATEGIGVSGFTVATFTDANVGAPATDFTATVTWGDGTSTVGQRLVSLGGGTFAVLGAATPTPRRPPAR